MPLETPARLVRTLASRGYNAEREAITLLARAPDPDAALARAVETAPADALVLTTDHIRTVLDGDAPAESTVSPTPPAADPPAADPHTVEPPAGSTVEQPRPGGSNPPVSTGDTSGNSASGPGGSAVETKGSPSGRRADPTLRSVSVAGDITGSSTGTGEYSDFVAVFRDRYEKLAAMLRGRVNHRPTDSLRAMPGGGEAGLVGMVADIRSTANGHWLVELEDPKGTFPCLVMKDGDLADVVDELLLDEVVAVEGQLSSDGGIIFVDNLYFPDVPRTHRPNTADRHVRAALISDVHVGSQEFMGEAWNAFADWLHTEEAEAIEYLLIAGDMVEGIGVYPNQDEELDIVDLYDQYEAFSEHLKAVPGDMEIVMIPGNHDAVRLAEPQPAFDEELRRLMSAHDARFTGNPSTVTLEGVNVLMYHGVSLDEVIAELPAEKASYEEPHKAMYQLLKKRHVAPQYGGHTRVAPEDRDYLVMENTPDVFHTGHVHKLGWGKYRNVLAVNSGCWQAQTDFQKSVNIDPDAGFAPVVDLDTLELKVYQFS